MQRPPTQFAEPQQSQSSLQGSPVALQQSVPEKLQLGLAAHAAGAQQSLSKVQSARSPRQIVGVRVGVSVGVFVAVGVTVGVAVGVRVGTAQTPNPTLAPPILQWPRQQL